MSKPMILVSTILLLANVSAQDKQPITKSMAFDSQSPSMVRDIGWHDGWLDDSHYIWVTRDDSDRMAYQKVSARTARTSKWTKPATDDLIESTDRTKVCWVENGNLHIEDLASGKKRQLTSTPYETRNPIFSPDGSHIAYTRQHNLYALELASGLERQLTSDGAELIYNGYASWVYYEEILGRASNYRAFWWSPDSTRIAFMRFVDEPVGLFSIYHSPGNYGSLEQTRYPKAGETNPEVSMGITEIATARTVWMDFDPREDAYIAWPFWTPDSKELHVQWMNRDQNQLKIYSCSVEDGTKRKIIEENQAQWVEFFDDITYLKDSFILRSDKSGYRHLYWHSLDGTLRQQLTSGDWTVSEIKGVDETRGVVYFMANRDDSSGSDLFVVNLGKGQTRKLTQPLGDVTSGGNTGTHRITFSPDYAYFIDEYTDYWTPTVVSLFRSDGTLVRELANSRNPEIENYNLAKIETFRIPSSDGYQLPAWWIIPSDLDRSGKTKYGILFRIYSGPGAPTVINRFGGRNKSTPSHYYRWDWSHHYYAQEGVITISVDHRASGHFGKKGIALMHRQLGHWELEDLSQAVRWLLDQPFIDKSRIGITGHSYGGYMTLLALAKAGDLFTHGVSGAPVTDWALYDTVYTERFMDTPQTNPEGYRDGSVLTYANQIKGQLRLIHGTIDDNVHMQNTTQLIDILTANGLQFELMIYPGSRHRIKQSKHATDGANTFWFKHFLGRTF